MRCRLRNNRRVAVSVCLQLILTNENYHHLVSIFLPLTGFASPTDSQDANSLSEGRCAEGNDKRVENTSQPIETSMRF